MEVGASRHGGTEAAAGLRRASAGAAQERGIGEAGPVDEAHEPASSRPGALHC